MFDLVKVLPVFLQLLLAAIGLLTAVSAFVNTVLRLLPAPWIQSVEKNQPRLAHLARATRAGGSDLLKFLKSLYAFAVGLPFAPSQSTPPATVGVKSSPGFASYRAVRAIALVMLVGAGIALVAAFAYGCSASDVHTQALVAHATADGFNRAQEHVLDQYEEAGRAAARASCCDRARMTAAVAAVDHAWVPVIVGWEAARVDHDAWREKLMQCQTTPAETCGVELVTLEHAFLRSATAARCALVALGEPDPLADVGAISCSSGSPSSSPPPPSSSAPPPTAPSAIPRPVPHLGGAS